MTKVQSEDYAADATVAVAFDLVLFSAQAAAIEVEANHENRLHDACTASVELIYLADRRLGLLRFARGCTRLCDLDVRQRDHDRCLDLAQDGRSVELEERR